MILLARSSVQTRSRDTRLGNCNADNDEPVMLSFELRPRVMDSVKGGRLLNEERLLNGNKKSPGGGQNVPGT